MGKSKDSKSSSFTSRRALPLWICDGLSQPTSRSLLSCGHILVSPRRVNASVIDASLGPYLTASLSQHSGSASSSLHESSLPSRGVSMPLKEPSQARKAPTDLHEYSASSSLQEKIALPSRGASTSLSESPQAQEVPLDLDKSVPGLSYIAAQTSMLNSGNDSGRCLTSYTFVWANSQAIFSQS